MTPATAPKSLLTAPDTTIIDAVETIRLGIQAQAAGEEVDNADEYRAAAKLLGMTEALERTRIEASRTFSNIALWPEEFAAQLDELNDRESEAAAAEKAADLALTVARNARRKAQSDRAALLLENNQARSVVALNRFLLGPLETAPEHADEAALTLQECGQISGARFIAWESAKRRSEKLAAIEKELAQK